MQILYIQVIRKMFKVNKISTKKLLRVSNFLIHFLIEIFMKIISNLQEKLSLIIELLELFHKQKIQVYNRTIMEYSHTTYVME